MIRAYTNIATVMLNKTMFQSCKLNYLTNWDNLYQFQKLITDSKMHELDKTIAIKLTRFASNKYSATAFLTLCFF